MAKNPAKTFIQQTLAVILSFSPHLLDAQVITSIERVSVAPQSNGQGNGFSYDPNISGDGRFVAFTSAADNFAAPGNVSGEFHEHAYIRDTLTGVTTQLDVTSDGRTGSPGHEFVPDMRVFRSSLHPHISRDGKYMVFTSGASDISPDGNGEAFGSWCYLKNLESGEIRRIPYATEEGEYPTYVAINGDGSRVIVIGIVGEVWELTVFNRNSGVTTILDTGIAGNKFNPSLSDDGRFLTFENQVGDFSAPTYSYLYDFETGLATQLNGGGQSTSPVISGDGNYLAFDDSSTVPMRVRLFERESGVEIPLSGGLLGEEPDGISAFPALSQDGRYLAFLSTSSNLVANDTNGSDDIFVYDRLSNKTILVSVQGSCKTLVTSEDFNTGPPSISSDGKTITFAVLERLIPADKRGVNGQLQVADTNTFDDVYVATLDYEAEPDVFKKNLTPNPPFVSVNCTGTNARLQLEDILASRVGAQRTSGRGTAIKKITQEIIISKITGSRQDVRSKLVAKRNTVTTPRLPPGNYTVKVQARALLKNGTKLNSRPSKPVKFTITN